MNATAPKGWFLYDGDCGLCRRWATCWEGPLRKRGFAIAPLQSPWVRQCMQMSEEALLQDVRLLLANGEQLQGADVYRYAMRHIWWAYPLYWFSITPLCRGIFDWGYRTFAAHRCRVSQACKLPSTD